MVGALFDTNIVIDFLNRVPAAKREIERYDTRAISVITWIEVMVGVPEPAKDITRSFLGNFQLLTITSEVMQSAVALRSSKKLKIPDAIIFATALAHGLKLVTRNTKDFSARHPSIRVPYTL